MWKKPSPLCLVLLGVVCAFLVPHSAQSHYCSDLHRNWKEQCKEMPDEAAQNKCYERGQKAYRQCLKDHPQCAMEDYQEASEKLHRSADHCSDLHDKWQEKCANITLNDTLRDECYAKGQKAYRQCLKEHPQCACQARCEDLEREVHELRSKIGALTGALNRRQQTQGHEQLPK